MTSKLKVSLLAILACLIWSAAFAGVKIVLQYTTPLMAAGLRFFLSGLLLLPFCGNPVDHTRTILTNYKSVALVSFFQTVLLYALFFIGMKMIPGAIGAIITGSSPLTAAIMAHLMMKDDKLSTGKLLKILLGISGIALIALSRDPMSRTGLKEIIGILLLLAGSISSAIGNIFVSKNRTHIDPIRLNSAQLSSGGLVLLLLSLIFEGAPHITITLPFMIALIGLAAISASGFSIWFYLLRQPGVKVSTINVWKFIIPVFGAILSWILLPGESPQLLTLLGMGIVSLSIIIFFKPAKKSAAVEV